MSKIFLTRLKHEIKLTCILVKFSNNISNTGLETKHISIFSKLDSMCLIFEKH